jgi:hypothetical protein
VSGYLRLVSTAPHACPVCGLLVSPEARFCSQCGTQLESAGTEGLFLAPQRRVFGVLAPGPTLVLAVVLLVAGVVALLVGSPIAAIILLALAAASLVLFYGAVERDPADPFARATLSSGRRVRGWARFASRSSSAWIEAGREVTRLTTESRSLRNERKRVLHALGDAAYREDDESISALRVRLHEIDDGLLARRQARDASLENARKHVHDEHVAAQPTQQFAVRDLTSGGPGDS